MDFWGILLPSLALVLGIATSAYFIICWLRHRHNGHVTGLLFWGLGLLLMYWFQIPAILIGLGKRITVTDFNFFFSLTFPITFLALIFFYYGTVKISGNNFSKRERTLFFVWFAAAILFFSYQFITNKGIISTYLLPLGGNVFFYLPVRILIALTALRLLADPGIRTARGIFGILCILGEAALGLARNIFVIKNTLLYPPQFWYLIVAKSTFFFTTQTLSVILLATGFFFIHRAVHSLMKRG